MHTSSLCDLLDGVVNLYPALVCKVCHPGKSLSPRQIGIVDHILQKAKVEMNGSHQGVVLSPTLSGTEQRLLTPKGYYWYPL